ncbi:hypothetical protein [Arthrobacter sp. ISL-69]|uniref:hypothetical protein n=1 Tax=Arthrobacter sp. ISL-69 TaxID=2819113 RepID=UPI001BE914B8|nr:hypothetical protein [Arthrobacter sp. ISL-69]MBT2535121.1 hypothetical protein [Arthrobacter sp. ISL-69]
MFAPARWLVVVMGVCSIFFSVTFVITLADGPDGFLSVAYWPALIGGWFASMFRPESLVEKQLANESHGPAGGLGHAREARPLVLDSVDRGRRKRDIEAAAPCLAVFSLTQLA